MYEIPGCVYLHNAVHTFSFREGIKQIIGIFTNLYYQKPGHTKMKINLRSGLTLRPCN